MRSKHVWIEAPSGLDRYHYEAVGNRVRRTKWESDQGRAGDWHKASVVTSSYADANEHYKMRIALDWKKIRSNPARYPMMSYAAAHAWEKQAAERGVSEVARSQRGFMRAYQRGNLSPWWLRRRDGFIARHMAQANRGERLWEKVRGKWRPTRRALALIMWAFMPPGRPAGTRP